MYIVQKQIENTWQNEGTYTIYEVALCKVLTIISNYNVRLINLNKNTIIVYKEV
jgi:hypothetical protein